MNEEWKDIKGYEGLYQVSNWGRVKSLNYGRTDKTWVLKCANNGHGYLQVTLSLNGCKKRYGIHRLVADAFIPNPNNLPQVNHKDGNKTNNNVNNLEWCTCKYNTQHAYNNGLNNSRKQVHCNELNMNFDSVSEATKYFGCGIGSIHNILNGRCKSLYKKYTFKYA